MTPQELAKNTTEQFFEAIEPLEEAYSHASFSYFAVKQGDKFILIQGTLYLNIQPPTMSLGALSTQNIRAGHYFLKDASLTPRQLAERLFEGHLDTPSGPLEFPPTGTHHAVHYQPFHEIGLQKQSRLTHLTVWGDQSSEYIDRAKIDWELRAAPAPYDGLNDLLIEFQPGVLTGVNKVEIAAFTVAAIDGSSSVDGDKARFVIRAALDAKKKKVGVSYRVLERGKVVARATLNPKSISWTKEGLHLIGKAEVSVQKAAVIHAFVSYGGIAQQHYYFGDPKSFQNPRRAAYEAFDPAMGTLLDIFSKAQMQREQRNFEAMMDWLFWMLGFSPASVGQTPRTSEGPDSILCTPDGHLAVVEYTVGLLKEDHKLPILHDRVQAMRRNLRASNMGHIRVLPVIVTAKTTEEIRAELPSARSIAAYVVTRETIDNLLERTLSPSSADQLYRDAEAEVASYLDAGDPSQIDLPLND